MPEPHPSDLEPRRRPTAPRARRTVQRILDATAALLDEVGFDAITTNLIAERAGVNVASLYKYFPNKYAVLAALEERHMERQRGAVGAALGDLADWREGLDRGIDAFLAHARSEPGFAAMTDAIRLSPVLRDLQHAGIPAMVQLVAERLERLKREARDAGSEGDPAFWNDRRKERRGRVGLGIEVDVEVRARSR